MPSTSPTLTTRVRLRQGSSASKKKSAAPSTMASITTTTTTTAAAAAAAAATPTNTPTHYNDWPNAVGFDAVYEEHQPVELKVQGRIPAYAAGVLFRTATGPRSIKDKDDSPVFQTNHWFDAFSQVHRFQLHGPSSSPSLSTSDSNSHPCIEKVTYNSRLTSDGLISKIQREGKLNGFTFAAQYEPCKSFFRKVQSVFEKAPDPQPNEANNAVTMSINYPGLSQVSPSSSSSSNLRIETLINKTDASRIQFIDPNTLEPLGLANQTSLHPKLKGVLSGAHAKSCPKTGYVYNYNLDFGGPKATYNIFRTSPTTGRTSILATISHPPAYLHSHFLSANFVILCIWNSHFTKAGASILWHRNMLDAVWFNDTVPAMWYVIDRRCPETEGGKGVVAKFESDPFFAFHTINAYEVPSRNKGYVDVLCDIPMFANTDVLHHFYMDNIISSHDKAKDLAEKMKHGTIDFGASLRRYRLPSVPSISNPATTLSSTSKISTSRARIDFTCPSDTTPELPTLNFKYLTRPHRYVYGITGPNGTKSTFVDGLVKRDLLTGSLILWEKEGHTPGEAIFIANPTARVHPSSSPSPESSEPRSSSSSSGSNQPHGETVENPTQDDDDEDNGILLTVVLDGFKGSSYLLCLDARDMTELGRVDVPGPIGFGFHGIWAGESQFDGLDERGKGEKGSGNGIEGGRKGGSEVVHF